MPIQKLKDFLEKKDIRYRSIAHRKAYSARRTAALAGIPEDMYAKSVMVKINEQMAMVVLPSNRKVDTSRIKEITRAKTVEIAREKDFKNFFPDCEIGAVPPFGNLYGVPVFISDTLPDDQEIAFKTGTHTETVKLPYQVYEGLVSPEAIKYSD